MDLFIMLVVMLTGLGVMILIWTAKPKNYNCLKGLPDHKCKRSRSDNYCAKCHSELY